MLPQAIRLAQYAVSRYHTRDPFEIIHMRKITLRRPDTFEDLLGYYVVRNRKQYIGISSKISGPQCVQVASHELGHSFVDYKLAAGGHNFNDTLFYSVSSDKAEWNANLFAAELMLPDEDILDRISYADYAECCRSMDEKKENYSDKESCRKLEQQMMCEFFEDHPGIPTNEVLAQEFSVDIHFIDFKLLALEKKGYRMPNRQDIKSNFLKNW